MAILGNKEMAGKRIGQKLAERGGKADGAGAFVGGEIAWGLQRGGIQPERERTTNNKGNGEPKQGIGWCDAERINAPRPLANGGKERQQQRNDGKRKKPKHQARICPHKIRESKGKIWYVCKRQRNGLRG